MSLGFDPAIIYHRQWIGYVSVHRLKAFHRNIGEVVPTLTQQNSGVHDILALGMCGILPFS
jgi:hypothetical protein